jgi:hypothetical protein
MPNAQQYLDSRLAFVDHLVVFLALVVLLVCSVSALMIFYALKNKSRVALIRCLLEEWEKARQSGRISEMDEARRQIEAQISSGDWFFMRMVARRVSAKFALVDSLSRK